MTRCSPVIEILGRGLRAGADVFDPPPLHPESQLQVMVARSRRKVIDGVEWLPDALNREPLSPPARLYRYDSLELTDEVRGYTADGRLSVVTNTFHLSWRELRA
jgi:hypothetical protein